MEFMTKVCAITLLFCKLISLNAGQTKSWICEHGATRWADTRTFFGGRDFVSITIPCRYKMANVRCGGDQTEIYVENSLDFHHGVAYITAVTVNITTVNNDNTTTQQILKVNNETLKEYLDDTDRAKKSPWSWSHEGSPIDEDKKFTGSSFTDHYGSAQYAFLRVGQLKISFQDVRPREWVRVRLMKPILQIVCFGAKLKAFENYPRTVCGGSDNNKKDIEALSKELPVDPHHYSYSIRDNYLILAKQNVKQTNPLCAEASDIVSGSCAKLGDKLYTADRVYAHDYRRCMDDKLLDPLKAYVASLHVLCRTSDMSSPETCQTLQQLNDTCGDRRFAYRTMEHYLSLTTCPSKTNVNATVTPTTPPLRSTPQRRVCKTQDKKVYGYSPSQKPYPGATDTFVHLHDIRIELPCRYKMADIQCGAARAVVHTDHALDAGLLAYINKVTVKITTTTKDGEVVTQTNKITNRKLRKYIEQGDLTKRLWRWSYSGAEKPKARDRILGQFNNITKSGEVVYDNLNITYVYIDPKDSNRSTGDYLVITCNDQHFTSSEVFPQTVCGNPLDSRSFFDLDKAVASIIPSDPHHGVEHDVVVFINQQLKQTKPLCTQLADITSGNCSDLGDKLYECYNIFRPPLRYVSSSYGECIRNNSMHPFKVYVACLRGLCGCDADTKDDTCNTLQTVHVACGDLERVHMKMSKLLARANCTLTS